MLLAFSIRRHTHSAKQCATIYTTVFSFGSATVLLVSRKQHHLRLFCFTIAVAGGDRGGRDAGIAVAFATIQTGFGTVNWKLLSLFRAFSFSTRLFIVL